MKNASLHMFLKERVMLPILSLFPDKYYLKLMFRYRLGYNLNLFNPQTYNEKLQWLKLYDRKPEYTTMVDKYAVKKYVADKIGEEYIIPTLGVWDDPDKIDFDSLPDKFVLKCTHNSGTGMYICRDKSKMDIRKVKQNLRKGLKENYYLHGREWPYKNVPRRIIAEKYMEDTKTKELRDYKVHTFNGKAKFCMIAVDRNISTKADYFDSSFGFLDFTWGYPHIGRRLKKPVNYEKMFKFAEILSQDIPALRVDFYEVDGKLYFGELTFFDGSGFDKIIPNEWNKKFGEWLKLPEKSD